jgi:glucosamine kinase
MKLIVDSGASKADWAFVENGKIVKTIRSSGISPIFHSSEDVFNLVSDTFSNESLVNQVERIFFYGAGCIKGHNTEIVESGLHEFFKNLKIDVQSDMIGAARALFGEKAGIACILGTGTNSCKYDGTSITERIPTLGFILGDECSGAYFGKILINNYFKKNMPSDLAKEFMDEYKLGENEVLDRVYKQAYPNRYLASFTYFLKKHQGNPYVKKMLADAFQVFTSNNIAKYVNYRKYPIGLVGSIAFHFSGIFEQIAHKNGIKIVKILERPIEGLAEYHV